MISVDQAQQLIDERVGRLPPAAVDLHSAVGLVLASELISHIDSPPFSKALMDGYAVRAADLPEGTGTLQLLEVLTAGVVAQHPIQPGQTSQIMTGTPLPVGADAVVRVEDTSFDEPTQQVHINTRSIAAGHNVLWQGTCLQQGEQVFEAGHRVRPQDIGVLAELGRAQVDVIRRPRVSILATGDELVPVGTEAKPGQITNSNEPMLAAQCRRAGAEPVCLGIARDDRSHLAERIQVGLEADIMLLSGGVSAGILDLVPSELEAAGVRKVFHKVRLKPGKPIWFGVRESAPNPCLVFGLPGNPVSSYVCFELFVRKVVNKLAGGGQDAIAPVEARLVQGHIARGDRPVYYPCHLDRDAEGWRAQPCAWQGSADLRGLARANAMIEFPAGDRQYVAGDRIAVIPWDGESMELGNGA